MELEIYQVDAFTQQAFKGNPAGVCITEKGLDESLMRQIAAEMALSETAFLALEDWRLRWFTPEVEVKLCGHGTLAVAHVLGKKGLVQPGEVLAFNTLSGTLNASFEHDAITLDFPAPQLTPTAKPSNEWLGLFGLAAQEVIECYEFEHKQLIVIDSAQRLSELAPQFDALKQRPGRGVVISAASQQQDYHFVSRYFAPWVGINEDPVTGSAHCALAQYWSAKLGNNALVGYQASPRGGVVAVEKLANQRVKLTGHAVVMLHGKMTLLPSDD